METPALLVNLKECVSEIPELKQIVEGFHNPHVKAWKTRLESLLAKGGTTCQTALENLRRIRSSLAGTEFIKTQTYINHLDVLEKSVKQAIRTIEVFGRPEDKHQPPAWARPKSQEPAIGRLLVGEEEVATDEISIHEVLDCMVSLAQDSNALSESMRDHLIERLNHILDDHLLQPFLGQNLDILLGHWPEFSDKKK